MRRIVACSTVCIFSVLLRPAASSSAPVAKVVDLLEELKSKVTHDGEVEQALYDKYACWCEETTRRKAYEIHENMKSIKKIGTMILALKGKSAIRDSEIAKLEKDIKDNEASQDAATSMRSKENKKYLDEKAEMEQTVGALEKGIMALSGAGTKRASLLRVSAEAQEQETMQTINRLLSVVPTDSYATAKQIQMLSEFKRGGQRAPQSATVQGILKDMYDTFAQNLEKGARSESEQQMAFEDVLAVKEKNHATLSAELKKKKAEFADFNSQLAAASEDMDDTSKEMKDSTEFFDATKAACSTKASEWSERSRMRTEELSGIAKALEILTSDEAKEMFSKAIKPGVETSLLQVGSARRVDPRQQVLEVLKKRAKKSGSMRLVLLANQVGTGKANFEIVVEEVDKMMSVLKQEEKEDIEERDWCKEETHSNQQEAARYEYKIEKVQTRINKLTKQLEDLESTLAETVQKIEETEVEVKEMEDQRTTDHEAFKTAKADDEAAAKLLGEAIESLSAYYRNNKALLVQEETKSAEEPSFSSGDKSKGESKGIVSILTMIKEDLELEIKNGVKNEKAAQKEFEKDLGKANKTIQALNDKKTNIRSSISTTNQSIDDASVLKEDTQKLLTEEENYLLSIKPDCDFMLNSFDVRREKRGEEMDGLLEAKALLQGANEA